MSSNADKEIADFLKASWAVDGKVKFLGNSVLILNKETYMSTTFELNDSRRGRFYVTMHKDSHKVEKYEK